MKFVLVIVLLSIFILITVKGWGNRRQPSRKDTTSPHPRKRWCCRGNKTCQPSGALNSRSPRGTRSCYRNCMHCLQLCLGVPPGPEVQRQAQMCLGYR
uniref:Pancreatic trypsin inhibitor n=1 Tax=Rhipicephalus appendiculatus TaxID=34631 RepID=A0A131YE00_RHIAP